MKKTITLFVWVLCLVASYPLLSQTCTGGGPASVLTLSMSGRTSFDEEGDASNQSGTLNSSIAGDVVAVAINGVNLSTVGGSWCDEAAVTFSTTNGGAGVFTTFSAQSSSGPCTDLPYTEFFDLVDLDLEFATGPGNTVFWELWEVFDDNPNSADANYTAGSIVLYVCPTGQALPLELTVFQGEALDKTNRIYWETAMESNVAQHVVERSLDGKNWADIGRQAGQMESNSATRYTFDDLDPLAKAYYRLRSVDHDGAFSYSKFIQISRRSAQFGIESLSPNPVSHDVTLLFSAQEESQVTVRVMDLTGRVVRSQAFDAVDGINQVTLLLADLQAGVYTVTVADHTQVSTPVRMVKQ
jgi:hypothetical protein